MTKRGRSARSCNMGAINEGLRSWVSEDVDEMRISISRHCSSQIAKGTAIPLRAIASSSARCGERLLTRKSETPRELKARNVFSLVSPAPSTSTFRPRKSPKIFSAKSTATDPTETDPRVISVVVRTCLATRKPRWQRRCKTGPVSLRARALS